MQEVFVFFHAQNLPTFSEILYEHGKNTESFFIGKGSRKTFLFSDSVHIIQNIRSNLLNKKRFFPAYDFSGFYGDIHHIRGN